MVERTGCQDGACGHASDCAVHNAPAYPPAPCDCGAFERLKAINTELVGALEKIAQIQRDKCENAGAEMLFMLLDNKVDIALAALAKAGSLSKVAKRTRRMAA